MLNKFFKTINKRYSKFFGFIFFLRYLIAIFSIAVTLFLTIPFFFNYDKRAQVVKNNVFKNYNFKIYNYEKISFKLLPLPNLEFKNVEIKLEDDSSNLSVENLKIFPKIFSIYNYENFIIDKIVLNNNDIALNSSHLINLIQKISKQKNKLSLNNLNIQIYDEKKLILKLNDLKFSNYKFKEKKLEGKIFEKKFILKTSDDYKNTNFLLLDTGINANINLNSNQQSAKYSGIFKGKILNSNLKFDFNYNIKSLKIYNFFFRSKSLSFNNDSLIILNPFLDIKSYINIEELDTDFFKKMNFKEALNLKDIIKKLNNKTEVNFKPKRFNKKIIDEINLKIDLTYGRLNYVQKFLISDNVFQCIGDINLLDEFPLLFFDCKFNIKNKKEFLKKFSIKSKKNDNILKVSVKGNLNILNNKINFQNISTDEGYKASTEDIVFFKNSFEKILFDGNFLDIFETKKIKDFIQEII